MQEHQQLHRRTNASVSVEKIAKQADLDVRQSQEVPTKSAPMNVP